MGNKHFSLLIETLELEEELSNTSLIDFSLNNIEKDNINKIWTFNFSGKNLPNSETLTLFIQKLRDSFSDEYIINYRFKLDIKVPTVWNNFINDRKDKILTSYSNIGVEVKDIVPIFTQQDVESVIENQEEKISKEIEKLEEFEKKEAERRPKEPEKKFSGFGAGGGNRYAKEIKDEDIVEIKDVIGYAGDVTIMALKRFRIEMVQASFV